MIQALLWLAVACGIAGALAGNRTAWPLLASVGLCVVLDYWKVPFSFFYWMLIDLAVIAAIIRRNMTFADLVILALFAPAWAFYLMPPDIRYQGGVAVVVAQLFLTFPHAETAALLRRARAALSGGEQRDNMVAHGRLAGAW